MGLRFDPVGGGKFKALVQQLIEVEKQPIKALEVRKARQEQRLELFREFKNKFGALNSSLSEIQNARSLRELVAELGDGEKLMGVTVDKNRAQPGSYQIQVDELASRASMISNAMADPNERSLGIGFVVVNLPDGGTWEAFIDQDEASLNGVARRINEIKDSPVRATVVQDAYDPEEKYRLIITAKKDGYFNGVDFPEFYFLDGDRDFWVERDIQAENALMKIDGFEVEADGNQVDDFLTGVNIDLRQADPEKPFTLQIKVDNQKIIGKVKEVVERMNEVLAFINLQNSVDESTDTRVTFTGDTGLQGIEYRFRNLLHEGFISGRDENDEPKIMHLYEMGINFSKEGALSFNQDTFNQAIEKDYEGVAEVLSGEFGLAYQLGEVLRGYTQPFNGLLALRERSLKGRIDQIDRNIERQERFVEQKTKGLVEKFSRLQSVLGAMQQQQQYISATLGGPSGGSLQQLLG